MGLYKAWLVVRYNIGHCFFYVGLLLWLVKWLFVYRRSSKASPTLWMYKDIQYGPKKRNRCDLFLPPTWNLGPNQLDVDSVVAPLQSSFTPSSPRLRDPAHSIEVPVVIFCHGGGWSSGSKRWYCQVGQELSKKGITCVTINYTLYPEGVCEDIVGDMELAVRFVAEQLPLIWKETGHWKHELQQTQDDPDNENDGNANDVHLVPKICLMGHSAGGHVALQYTFVRHPNFAALQMHHKDRLAVYDESLKVLLPDDGSSLLRDSRRVASLVDSVICLSAVFSITKHFEVEKKRGIDNISKMKDVMGGPTKFLDHSPLELLESFVQDGSEGTVLDFGEDKELTRPLKVRFVHGTNDTTIPMAASKDMFDLLQSVSGTPKDVLCGGTVSYVPLSGCNHTQIIFHLMGSSLRFSTDLFLAVTSIFD